MTREELIEKVGVELREYFCEPEPCREISGAVIDIVLEEAAKIAEGYWWDLDAHPLSLSAEQVKYTAKAIRALKGG